MAITCDITLNGLTATGLYVRFIEFDVVRDSIGRRIAQWTAAYKVEVPLELNEAILEQEYASLQGEKPTYAAYRTSRLGAVKPKDVWHKFATGRTLVSGLATAEAEAYVELKAHPLVRNATDVFEGGQA